MNLASLPLRSRLILWVGLACGCNQLLPAAPAPYTPDADTLHLWHLNEVQNTNTTLPAFYVNDVSMQTFYSLAVTNGAKMAVNPISANLTNALDTRGITGAPQYQAGAFGDDNLHWYPDDFAGTEGAFTFEALVCPDFDPAIPDVARPPMQILSLENEGGTEARVFQFRLNSSSTNEPWRLEFQNIGSAMAGSNAVITTTFIDDFSGGLGSYTHTRVLDQGSASNVFFLVSNEVLYVSSAGADGAEQVLFLRGDHSLPVGQMLVADVGTTAAGWDRDIGIAVSSTATPPGIPDGVSNGSGVRSNYVEVSFRMNNQVTSIAISNTTVLPSGQEFADNDYGGDTFTGAPDALFIERLSETEFQVGWIEGPTRHVLTANGGAIQPYVVPNTVGAAVGFYADVRASIAQSPVGLDNLRLATNSVIVPPADPELFSVLLPTNGADVAVQGGWYHVAVAYNGLENTPNNLILYWTALSGSPTSASVLGSFQMTNDLGSASGGATIEADFAIGNEGRDAPGESFQGFIDEVRISDVARSATGFNLNGTPYTADANTTLLYHLDEANPADFPTSLLNSAFDAVALNEVNLDVRNGAVFGATAYSGAFNTALTVNDATNDAAGAYANPGLAFTQFSDPTTGAFTYEALIRPDFDPNSPSEHMQIVSMEGDAGDRPFQWKFLERTNTAIPLEVQFININNVNTNDQPEFLNATVPTIGPHAIVQSQWYHVAVTYNGDTNDANNLQMYWTALDSGATSANALVVTNTSFGGTRMTADIIGTAGDFAVGNEDRSSGGGSTDALVGVVDEIRVSKVARTASQFLLAPPRPEIASISVNSSAGTATLVWTSQAGTSYTIGRSLDLTLGAAGWSDVATGIAGTSPRTTNTVNVSGSSVELYRVEVE